MIQIAYTRSKQFSKTQSDARIAETIKIIRSERVIASNK
jgi:hypothetical protein